MKNRIALPSGITFSVITVALSMVGAASAADRSVPKQYPTIQAAINASSAGDTVSVALETDAHLAGNHAALEQLFRARVITFLVEAGLLPLD